VAGERDGPEVGPKLVGTQLSLGFVNTVDWRTSAHPVESLGGYPDLVAWGAKAGAISEDQARELLAEAERRPDEATAALARAIALREALYRVFVAPTDLAHGAADVATLNAELRGALARLRLAPGEASGRFAWELAGGDDLGSVLGPVALSAAELLTSDGLARIRTCEGEGCGWLFLDTSRNRSRRWCSMDSCGNRAKAKRHYERTKRGGV